MWSVLDFTGISDFAVHAGSMFMERISSIDQGSIPNGSKSTGTVNQLLDNISS